MFFLVAEDFWLEEVGTIIQKQKITISYTKIISQYSNFLTELSTNYVNNSFIIL